MKILSFILIISLSSCSVLPCGHPDQVRKWEKKKFRAQLTRECDSLRHVKGLAAFRKY